MAESFPAVIMIPGPSSLTNGGAFAEERLPRGRAFFIYSKVRILYYSLKIKKTIYICLFYIILRNNNSKRHVTTTESPPPHILLSDSTFIRLPGNPSENVILLVPWVRPFFFTIQLFSLHEAPFTSSRDNFIVYI